MSLFLSTFSIIQEAPTLPDVPVDLITILGVIAPLLIQLINRKITSKAWRVAIGYGLSFVTGIIAASMAGLLNFSAPEQTAMAIFGVFGFTQFMFTTVWKPLIFGNSNKINRLFPFFSNGAEQKKVDA